MAKKTARKSPFGLSNNLPLLLSIVAVVFIVPLVILAFAGNMFFKNSAGLPEDAIIYRAELGTISSQPVTSSKQQFLLKSTLNHSYKLYSTNVNVPEDFSPFLGKDVFVQGYVKGVNFYVNAINSASSLQKGLKTEGYIMESGNNSLTREGVYYFSGTKTDTKGGYLITSYPDRLKALVGLKVKVSGNVWTSDILNKPLLNAMDLAPIASK